MFGNRGFTLIEVVVAVVILGIVFGVIFDMLYKAKRDIEYSQNVFDNTITLDKKIKIKDFEHIQISEKRVPEYPLIYEINYKYRDISFIRYEHKR